MIYEQLTERLTEMGIPESKASVTSMLSRGSFSAAFFLASIKTIGCPAVRVENLQTLPESACKRYQPLLKMVQKENIMAGISRVEAFAPAAVHAAQSGKTPSERVFPP